MFVIRLLYHCKFHLLFLLWFIPFALSGQRYISGRITDAEDGVPIPAATVFLPTQLLV